MLRIPGNLMIKIMALLSNYYYFVVVPAAVVVVAVYHISHAISKF